MYNTDRAIAAQSAGRDAALIVASLGITDPADAAESYEAIRNVAFLGTQEFAEDGTEATEAPAPVRTKTQSTSRPKGGNKEDHGAGVKLQYGKHAGKTIAEAYEADAEWVQFIADTGTNDFIRGKCGEYLASLAA